MCVEPPDRATRAGVARKSCHSGLAHEKRRAQRDSCAVRNSQDPRAVCVRCVKLGRGRKPWPLDGNRESVPPGTGVTCGKVSDGKMR